MKNTVSFGSPDFRQHSQGIHFNRFQYPISTFSCFPKGVHGKVFTQEPTESGLATRWCPGLQTVKYLSQHEQTLNKNKMLFYFPN